jgi:hypothetical protein
MHNGNEGKQAVIRLTRNGNTSGISSVAFSTLSGGTATAGATCSLGVDYVSVAGQTVVFNPGVTTHIVSVTLCGDRRRELSETVNLALTNPVGGVLGTPSTAILAIWDTANIYGNPVPLPIVPGSPVTSSIDVSDFSGIIGSIRITLFELSHTSPDNLDLLLVGPNGAKYVLMGDAGGSNPLDPDEPVSLTFSDFADSPVPDSEPLTTGQHKPATWETPVASFPAPAPAGPYIEPGSQFPRPLAKTMIGSFGLFSGNGTWRLYVRDDGGAPLAPVFAPGGETGEISGGWGLELLTSAEAGAEVSGRVLTPSGLGLRNAIVSITDSNGNRRTATTSSFGFYQFEDVELGGTYVIGVSSKRYRFTARLLQVFEALADVDFVGLE